MSGFATTQELAFDYAKLPPSLEKHIALFFFGANLPFLVSNLLRTDVKKSEDM